MYKAESRVGNLHVSVAEWGSTHGGRSIFNGDGTWVGIAHLQDILESSGRCAEISHSGGTIEGKSTFSRLEVLPDPVGAIDLCVVEVEGWVAGRGEDVAAGVAAEGEVPGGVDAVETGAEVALHCCSVGV